jgi:putative DNA primase/helicase
MSAPEDKLKALPTANVSVFDNAFGASPRTVSLESVISDIRLERYAEQVKALRDLLNAGDEDGYKRGKRGLPVFTLSALCSDRKTLVSHSGLIQADLDKLNGSLLEIRDRIKADPHVAGGFVSPSGTGLKVAVRVPASQECHGESFQAVERYIAEAYGAEIDKACKDPLRLCFFSSDPDAWLNKDATELDVEKWRPLPAQYPENQDSAGMAQGTLDPANDAGRAQRFVDRYADNIRYVPEKGLWLIWQNGRWQPDLTGGIERLAIELSLEMLSDVATITGTDASANEARRAASKEALACGDRQNIRNMLSLAAVNLRVILSVTALDSDPWVVGARNAVIDLRTGKIRSYTRSDYITRVLDVDADPEATCPRWQRFLEETLPRETNRKFLWKAAGYSLTGTTREQCFFFLHGCGANGKSTLLETLETLSGGCAERAGKGLIAANKRGDYPLREAAAIIGSRLLLASETDECDRFNEGVIKDITGGESMRGAFLYKDAVTFKPQCKLWIAGNHKPRIHGTDNGIWRRVRLIPFARTFSPEERDPELAATLQAEASGILNWAIAGCLLWQKEGLAPPAEIEAAVADYRSEEDMLADFINECVSLNEPRATLLHSELFRKYDDWAGNAGVRYPLSKRGLSKALRERGWRGGDKSGQVQWYGVQLREAR